MSAAYQLMLACAVVFAVSWAVVTYVVLPAQLERVQKALLAETLEAKTFWMGRVELFDNFVATGGLVCLVSVIVFCGTASFEAWEFIQQHRINK